MQYWVCYDIADAGAGTRVGRAPRLRNAGGGSVFQCLIEPPLAGKMLKRIHAIIEPHTDKVHVIAVCDTCASRTVTYGIATQASDPEYWIL